MNTENNPSHLSEEDIDEAVIAQADDDEAWEEPISVYQASSITVSLPPELAARVAFFAHLHKKPSAEEWLKSIIQQRIDFEEAAFAELKQALATSN
jgi:hypothetical protein